MTAEESAATPAVLDIPIAGMTCAACVARVQEKLDGLPGVQATVNLATERARVVYREPVTPADVTAAIVAAGYRVAGALPPRPEYRTLLPVVPAAQGTPPVPVTLLSEAAVRPVDEAVAAERRLRASAALTIPVVTLAMAPTLQFPAWQWVSLTLTLPVVIWCAAPFHRSAAWHARHAGATMDTLVSVGVLASFGWSLYALLFGGAGRIGMQMSFSLIPRDTTGMEIYLEVAAGVTTLILLGRHIEARARSRAGAVLRSLLDLGARQATLLRGDEQVLTPADELVVGDRFLVRPGEKVATDGVVEEGTSAVDASLLTGEAEPVEVRPGSPVTGAVLNAGRPLVVRATRVGADTALAHIARTVADAQSGKAAAQRLADRVAGTFVPLVLVLAAGTAGFWLGRDASASFAVAAAVAVLIIACPCALGLATPLALLVGTGRGAQLGILIRGPEALERTARLDTVLLDKTGTLTTGMLRVRDVVAAPGQDDTQALRAAAAVESVSEHPIGAAVVRAAVSRGVGTLPPAAGFGAEPGRGVWAEVEGRQVAVGRLTWVTSHGFALLSELDHAREEAENAGSTVVAVAWGQTVRALVVLEDALRPESLPAVEALRGLGLRPYLLTGDAMRTGQAVARQLRIRDVQAAATPEDKLGAVRRLQGAGHGVVVVGDGLNDAAALAQADLGIAMGSGADAAIQASDMTLVRADPRLIADGIRLARRTLAVIHGNLFWAFAYNCAALPLAAGGYLNPVLAGAAMACSSLFVAGNSLRLRRFAGSVR